MPSLLVSSRVIGHADPLGLKVPIKEIEYSLPVSLKAMAACGIIGSPLSVCRILTCRTSLRPPLLVGLEEA